MYKRFAGAAIFVMLLPTVADAQLLRVGPFGGVRVRAPFVSVDVSPFGGTRVRAPFTSVDTRRRGLFRRGYRYGPVSPRYNYNYQRRDYYAVPAYPMVVPQNSYRVPYSGSASATSPQYDIPRYSEVFPPSSRSSSSSGARWQTGDDPTQLAGRLSDAAGRLRQSLQRRQEGSAWIDYLRPDAVQRIGQNLAQSRNLQSVRLSEVRSLLANFDGVTANPSLAWVTQLNGFSDTRRSLHDLAAVLEAGPGGSRGAGSPRETSPSARAGTPQREPDRQRGEELPVPPPDPQPSATTPRSGDEQPRRESQRDSDGRIDSEIEPPPPPRPEPDSEPRSDTQPRIDSLRGSQTQPPPEPRPSSDARHGDETESQDRRPPAVRGDV